MKRLFLVSPLVILAALLAAFACNKVERKAAATMATTRSEQAGSSLTAAEPQPARMIVRNATASLVVRDAVEALSRITTWVEAKGGYIAETRQWKESNQVRATATFRVPAAQLSQALAAIRSMVIRVESENVNAQDVSQEYSDLGAQLRNLQATETELRALLTTVRQRTQKASEVMEVYNEISRVRGEIEKTQGRILYLSQMTALATVTVELIPDVLAAPVVEPGWQPVGTVRAASRFLINSLKVLADAAIWIVLYFLPLGLLFGTLVLAIRRGWRRAHRAIKSPATPDPTAP